MRKTEQMGKTGDYNYNKLTNNGMPAGLARTRKIIRATRDNEIQFLKICSKIRLDNYKHDRAKDQRDIRRAKRQSA